MAHFQSIEEENGITRITYKDQRFYEAHDAKGEYVPSVTTYLNAAPKGRQFYEWIKKHGDDSDTIMMEAAERGSRVHGATEQLDKTGKLKLVDDNGNCPYYLDEIFMIYRYLDFIKRYTDTPPICVEGSYASKELDIAGTIDRVWKLNDDKVWLFDIKTGNVYDYYFMQLAAYKKIFEHFNPNVKIEKVGVLWLKSATRTDKEYQGKSWQLVQPPKPLEYYWDMFVHTRAMWKFENEKAKPSNFEFEVDIDLTK